MAMSRSDKGRSRSRRAGTDELRAMPDEMAVIDANGLAGHRSDRQRYRSDEADAAWRELLGPLLDDTQVRELLKVSSQDLHAMVDEHALLALPTKAGETVYPRFQFTAEGRVYPALPRILAIFDGAVVTTYSVASWLKGPKDYLGGLTPIRWLELERDPESVIAGAEVAAARLAH